ncbi:MAG: lytic transglycosylase domain-containing protein [Mariprofundaceae bacterium]|nr:lytic transglycosylase domain-containing protein [Mariprofundaceae bacterium]
MKPWLRKLATTRHKGVLVVMLAVGFLLTLPVWLMSSDEEKQRLTQTTATMRIVEHHVGLFDVSEDERQQLQHALQASHTTMQVERDAWVSQIIPTIQAFGSSEHEAQEIARWVWVYGQRHQLQSSMILALMTIESRFDPYAVSSVGAQGLMQIMPFWKKELGSDKDNLYDVETNIRYGCAILKHYIKRYGTAHRALAAYNGSLGKDKYPNKVFSQVARFE